MIDNGILKTQSIGVNDIEYLGLIISKEGIEKIQEFLDFNNISLIATLQPNLHMTCHYFRGKGNVDKNLLPKNDFLGKELKIHINGYGELKNEQGVILNQGLLVDRKSLEDIIIGDKRLTDFISIEKPHITISVNKQKVDGKPIAKAQDTYRCAFKSEIENRNIDFMLTCKLAVVRFGKVFENIDYGEQEKI